MTKKFKIYFLYVLLLINNKMKIKYIIIIPEEQEVENVEGIYLIDPVWIHLDEKEVQERLENNQKIFKINFGG